MRQHLLALKAHGFGQAQPGFDTALLALRTVVVKNALQPFAAGVAIGAVGQDRRILERDVQLVVEAIGHPPLNLLTAGVAGIHRLMKRVVNVVVRALGAQGLLKLGRAHGGLAHQYLQYALP